MSLNLAEVLDPGDDISLISAFLRALKPDPKLSVNEWANEYRFLPSSNSEPGRFRSSRTPYMDEISERLSARSKAQIIILMKAAQVAATELGNNWVGYTIDLDPANFLYIMPNDTMAKSVSKNRIAKMISLSPTLSKKISPARQRDSGNTMLEKEFEGGLVKLVGANAPAGLSSFNAKKVYADEVDRYPQDVANEGDVISLAFARTTTFGDSRKILITSTPTAPETSIVNREFDKTGQRFYHVPCPLCGTYQKLIPEQLKWEAGKYDDVRYECIECGDLFEEHHKTEMLAQGQWVADHPEKEDGITFGYHLGGLLSPLGWYSWRMWAVDHDDALSDQAKMKVFVNTRKGYCYSAGGEAPKWEAVYNKRESYEFNKPNEHAIYITIGADVQRDRIELEIVGWGAGKENWSIDFRIIWGDTRTISSEVWGQLDQVVNETWVRADGAILPNHLMAIDSSDNTAVVLEYCSRWSENRVIAIKGRANMASLVTRSTGTRSKNSTNIGATKHWNVGVDLIKAEVYGLLNLQIVDGKPVPKGYCHFPMYDENHFKSLTAERLEFKKDKLGKLKQQWVKHYERNEKLDCRVYARAAAFVLGIDNLTDKMWEQRLIESKSLIPDAPKPLPKRPSGRRDDYWNGRNGR